MMTIKDRLITLKEAVMYSNHAEENIRLQIERGFLKKYNKNGVELANPLSKKGYFKLFELMEVYNITNPEEIKRVFLKRKLSEDSVKNVLPKKIIILRSKEMNKIVDIEDNSIDTWFLFPKYAVKERIEPTSFSDISSDKLRNMYRYLDESNRILNSKGNVLIHSIPRFLPYFGVYLSKLGWFFKYWIIYSAKKQIGNFQKRYTSESNGILFFVRSKKIFRINKIRTPYMNCSFCNKPLKDYGGKKHLQHVDGMIISDVWHQVGTQNGQSRSHCIHSDVLKRLIDLSCNSNSTLLLAPFDGEISDELRK